MTKRELEHRQWQDTALGRLGLTPDEIKRLRRASGTLHRWAERECGGMFGDWAIERDEVTGRPFNVWHGGGTVQRYAIADLEASALRTVADVCTARGIHYFHQRDPRGASLYVAREALTDSDYSKGIAVY